MIDEQKHQRHRVPACDECGQPCQLCKAWGRLHPEHRTTVTAEAVKADARVSLVNLWTLFVDACGVVRTHDSTHADALLENGKRCFAEEMRELNLKLPPTP